MSKKNSRSTDKEGEFDEKYPNNEKTETKEIVCQSQTLTRTGEIFGVKWSIVGHDS